MLITTNRQRSDEIALQLAQTSLVRPHCDSVDHDGFIERNASRLMHSILRLTRVGCLIASGYVHCIESNIEYALAKLSPEFEYAALLDTHVQGLHRFVGFVRLNSHLCK